VSRARKRARDAPTFVASISLRVTPTQARTIRSRFECGRLLYNSCLREALDRAVALRADPGWAQAKAMPRIVKGTLNPARASAFQELRQRHGFTTRQLRSVASGFRVGWLREQVFAQEAQVLGARAYDAVNRWLLGQQGRPRFKGKGHGLHSLAGKDLQGALRISADGAGLQWGHGLVLPFALDPASPYHWWAAWHVGEGRLRSCRIVRTRVRDRWIYAAQLVLDGEPVGPAARAGVDRARRRAVRSRADRPTCAICRPRTAPEPPSRGRGRYSRPEADARHERVAALLADGPLSRSEIAERLDVPPLRAYISLYYLRNPSSSVGGHTGRLRLGLDLRERS
jgi:hypothetical protein